MRDGSYAATLASALSEHDLRGSIVLWDWLGFLQLRYGVLIPSLRRLGVDSFKRRVRIVKSSWQIADVVKRRVALEHAAA